MSGSETSSKSGVPPRGVYVQPKHQFLGGRRLSALHPPSSPPRRGLQPTSRNPTFTR